jgi:hypothetical protein
MAKLFEYAVIHHPKERRDAMGNDVTPKDQILKDVTRILANTDKEVGMLASREIPPDYLDKLDEVEIVVRPF